MADLYTILPVNSDPKYGLGLLPTDLETFHFPSLCRDLATDHLLTLDSSESVFLACPDTAEFYAYNGILSRTPTTAATPQSECSTRTNISTRNISPTSDIISFRDEPAAQHIETMYHDTTQAIVSGRQSRAVSATWPSTSSSHAGLSSSITLPAQPSTQLCQSFSYRTPQLPQQDTNTPPLPSNFFPSPNLQSQPMAAQSAFVSPSLQSAMMPHEVPSSTEHRFMQTNLTPAISTFYSQPQLQNTPARQLPQNFQTSPLPVLQQQQFQQQFQQQAFSLSQTDSRRHSVQAQIQAQIRNTADLFSQNPSHTLTNSIYQAPTTQPSISNMTAAIPNLPNTTGNSTTGYQCFSHGCGGRHFSNWGNLVRHHRERQLRSKAGAKPTCPRCAKGFTRSSARDAHVAGLKCVLGRRRRGAHIATSAGASTSNGHASTSPSGGEPSATGTNAAATRADTRGVTGALYVQNGKNGANARNHNDNDHDEHSDGSADNSGDEEDDEDDMEMLGSKSGYNDHDTFLIDGAFELGGGAVDAGQSYLAPQHLSFER